MGNISLGQFWQSGTWNENVEYDKIRDSHMAWEISQIRDRPEETLVVIGAAHERGIRKHLEKGTGEPVTPTRKGKVETPPRLEFIPLAPSLMHDIGWMEMPYLAEMFARYLLDMTPQRAREEGFDFRTALENLIETAIRHYGKMSLRSCNIFRRMINEVLTLKSSWMVESIAELSSLGEACVNRQFGTALREVAEQSSLIDGTDPGQPRALFVETLGGLLCRLSDGSLCSVTFPREDHDASTASTMKEKSIRPRTQRTVRTLQKGKRGIGGPVQRFARPGRESSSQGGQYPGPDHRPSAT